MTFYFAFYMDAFDIKLDHSGHGVLFKFTLTASVHAVDTLFCSLFRFATGDKSLTLREVSLLCCLLTASGLKERKRKQDVRSAVREPARLHQGVVRRRRVEAGARACRRPAPLFRHTPGERLGGHLCPPSPPASDLHLANEPPVGRLASPVNRLSLAARSVNTPSNVN